MNKFLFVVGPTCSGKNDYAYELSKLIDIEIINADSIQVYKQLKILSNRPTEKELKIVPHHLYGHINNKDCLLYTSPSPRDGLLSRMPSSA